MGAALLALHRSTGERKWLQAAVAAGDFIAATFIDPIPYLCTNGQCPYRDHGRLLYFDYGHLSTLGSERAARAYMPLGAGGGTRTPTP